MGKFKRSVFHSCHFKTDKQTKKISGLVLWFNRLILELEAPTSTEAPVWVLAGPVPIQLPAYCLGNAAIGHLKSLGQCPPAREPEEAPGVRNGPG